MMNQKKHFHFIGIGGIGMSALAQLMLSEGHDVSGCDTTISTPLCQKLASQGCQLSDHHDPSHSEQATHVIYSSSIRKDNPEFRSALENNKIIMHRAALLADIAQQYKTIAVTGAHGKTTTTSLISHIFTAAGKSPTFVVGGILANYGSNAQRGSGHILIAEADESDRSLLHLQPTTAIITNVDYEHPETYASREDMVATMGSFVANIKPEGTLWLCAHDQHLMTLLNTEPTVTYKTFAIGNQNATLHADAIELLPASSIFTVYQHNKPLGSINLPLPGNYNILNALAAIGVALDYNIDFAEISDALATFSGVQRRFEFKGSFNGAAIFDDYAHHPTEIFHTLIAAQRRKTKKLHVIFQLHRYTRTAVLWNDFIELFTQIAPDYMIDSLCIVPLHTASEEPIPEISATRFAQELTAQSTIPMIIYCNSFDEAEKKYAKLLMPEDLLITIGAGKVFQIGERLASFKNS